MPKAALIAAMVWMVMASVSVAETPDTQPVSPNPSAYSLGEVLYSDAFAGELTHWKLELEKPGTASAAKGVLTVDVPRLHRVAEARVLRAHSHSV